MKGVVGFVLVAGCVGLVAGTLRGSSDCDGNTGAPDCWKSSVLLGRMGRVAPDPSDVQLRSKIDNVPATLSSSKAVEDPKTAEVQPRVVGASTHALHDKATLEGRGRKKKASALLLSLMLVCLKAMGVTTLVMVAFIKKIVLIGALVLLVKSLYYKTDHTVGFEHLHQPYYPQHDHHWHDYGKQYGGDYGQQDSYRYYAQQVTSHAGLQAQT